MSPSSRTRTAFAAGAAEKTARSNKCMIMNEWEQNPTALTIDENEWRSRTCDCFKQIAYQSEWSGWSIRNHFPAEQLVKRFRTTGRHRRTRGVRVIRGTLTADLQLVVQRWQVVWPPVPDADELSEATKTNPTWRNCEQYFPNKLLPKPHFWPNEKR